MKTFFNKLRLCCCILMIAAGMAAGCGTSNQPTDKSLAINGLTSALDAWRQGDTPAALRERSPSIVMGDADWNNGQRLVGYELLGDDVDDGFNLHCPVNLTFQQADGEPSTRRIVYVVGTHPVLTVFRE